MPSTDTKLAGGAVWAGGIAGSVRRNVSAAGSTQATATPIQDDIAVFTTAAANTGTILPAKAQPSDDYFVINYGANPLAIYPPVGGKANNGAVNAAVSVPVGKTAHCICVGPLEWAVIVGA